MARSKFAIALEGLFDQTDLFDRKQWADFLCVSTDTISEWLDDKTIPRSDLLFMIFDTLKESDVDQSHVEEFLKVSKERSDKVSPYGNLMFPTVFDYMNRRYFD